MSKTTSGLSEGEFDSIYVGDISSIYATSNYTLTLPSTQGTVGQVLTTSGIKATNWSSVIDVIGVLPIVNGGTGSTTATGTGQTVLSSSPTLSTPVVTPLFRVKSNTDKTVTMNPFYATADYTLMLPETAGTPGQVLTAGNPMTWVSPDSTATNGVARWKQATPDVPYCNVSSGQVVTLEGIISGALWNVGNTIRVNLYQVNTVEFGDYSKYGTTTILTSIPNTPTPGVTRITFSSSGFPVAPGRNGCYIIPAPQRGNSCTVTSNVLTYSSDVLPGQWYVGAYISAIVSGLYGPTDANDTLVETTIITAVPNTPSAGFTTITFAFTATDGEYIIKSIFPGAQQQTWNAYGGIDFETFEEQVDTRGLALTVTPGNYGRFVNPYTFPVIALVTYNVARYVFTFPTNLPDTIPLAAFLNGAFTEANGQTVVWLEANDNGKKLAQGAAAAAQPVNGSASIVLDPGEYFQLRGFNNSLTNSGIWSGSEVYIILTRIAL